MMMNWFCGMVDKRSPPSQISDTPRAKYEPVQNLSSSFVDWSCAVVITTTPRHHFWRYYNYYGSYCIKGTTMIGATSTPNSLLEIQLRFRCFSATLNNENIEEQMLGWVSRYVQNIRSGNVGRRYSSIFFFFNPLFTQKEKI